MLCPHSAPWAPVVTVEWGRHQLLGAAMLGSQCAFSGQRRRAVLCTEGGARLFTEDRLLEPEAILLFQCDFQHLKIALGRTSLELKFSPRTQPPENTCHEAKSIFHPSIHPSIHPSVLPSEAAFSKHPLLSTRHRSEYRTHSEQNKTSTTHAE